MSCTARPTDERLAVLATLRGAGIDPRPGEIEALVESYRAARRVAAALHTLPEMRYHDPAPSVAW